MIVECYGAKKVKGVWTLILSLLAIALIGGAWYSSLRTATAQKNSQTSLQAAATSQSGSNQNYQEDFPPYREVMLTSEWSDLIPFSPDYKTNLAISPPVAVLVRSNKDHSTIQYVVANGNIQVGTPMFIQVRTLGAAARAQIWNKHL